MGLSLCGHLHFYLYGFYSSWLGDKSPKVDLLFGSARELACSSRVLITGLEVRV